MVATMGLAPFLGEQRAALHLVVIIVHARELGVAGRHGGDALPVVVLVQPVVPRAVGHEARAGQDVGLAVRVRQQQLRAATPTLMKTLNPRAAGPGLKRGLGLTCAPAAAARRHTRPHTQSLNPKGTKPGLDRMLGWPYGCASSSCVVAHPPS